MGRRTDAAVHAAWRSRWQRFQGSGLTVAAFCRREGISQAAFYQWRKRLTAPRPAPTDNGKPAVPPAVRQEQAAFVPVAWLPARAVVEIEGANGVRVRVPADQEAALVTTLRTVGSWTAPQREPGQEDARC